MATTTASQELNKTQAAAHLGISAATLDRWHAKGDGPPNYRIGGRRRYLTAELDAWARSRRAAS